MLVFTEPTAQQPVRSVARAEGLGERGDLDRVAQVGAAPVRLHVADGGGLDVGHRSASPITAAWPSTLGAV